MYYYENNWSYTYPDPTFLFRLLSGVGAENEKKTCHQLTIQHNNLETSSIVVNIFTHVQTIFVQTPPPPLPTLKTCIDQQYWYLKQEFYMACQRNIYFLTHEIIFFIKTVGLRDGDSIYTRYVLINYIWYSFILTKHTPLLSPIYIYSGTRYIYTCSDIFCLVIINDEVMVKKVHVRISQIVTFYSYGGCNYMVK